MHVIVVCTTDQVFSRFLVAALDVPYTDQNRQGSYYMQFNSSSRPAIMALDHRSLERYWPSS